MNYFDSLKEIFDSLENKKDFLDYEKIHSLILPLSVNTEFDKLLADKYLELNKECNIYQYYIEKGVINGTIQLLLAFKGFANSKEEKHLISTTILGVALCYDVDAEDKIQEYFAKIEALRLKQQEEARTILEHFFKELGDQLEDTRKDEEYICPLQKINLVLLTNECEIQGHLAHEIEVYEDDEKIDISSFMAYKEKAFIYIAKKRTNKVIVKLPFSSYFTLNAVNSQGSIKTKDLEECYFQYLTLVSDNGEIDVSSNAKCLAINTDSSDIHFKGKYEEKKVSSISGKVFEELDQD